MNTVQPFWYVPGESGLHEALNPTLVQPVDIATIGSSTPVTRSLSEHLEKMFVELMSDAPASGRTIQLECRYEYCVQTDLEPVSVPLMFVPPMHFVLERDGMVPEGGCPSNALGKIAGTITGWFNTHPSPSADGRLRVDIVVFSRSTPPLPVRLRSFTLALHYIAPRLTTTG